MHSRTVIRVGNSYGVTIPGEFLRLLGVSQGDLVSVAYSQHGYIIITKPDRYSTQKGAKDSPPFHP